MGSYGEDNDWTGKSASYIFKDTLKLYDELNLEKLQGKTDTYRIQYISNDDAYMCYNIQ